MTTILNKYAIEELLGEGKFGKVYKGLIIKTKESVAIKMEPKSAGIPLLRHETNILNHLYRAGCRCVPFIYWYGIYNNYTTLVMTYYKISLQDFIERGRAEFSEEQINKIMAKTIELVENIHIHYVVHRDLKPHNFMFGQDGELYIIDFGLANIYVDEDKKHIKPSSRELVMGNHKYMSYNIYCGNEATRRDDMISLGYMYIYLRLGVLPWDDVKIEDTYCNELHIVNKRNQYRKICKSWENIEELCSQLDPQFYRYMDYCYRLSFEEIPLYEELKKLFLVS